ncbi:hypothetical protein [uncultured Schumannella sp.]|uniref:hypothetical protein n=1 Tax=uncultured Schumannella sp. TaxID=1195956 RepID=UPI0025E1C43B|nr:hypothetical protein [uncultured Schumannella sp.]
MSDQDQTNPAEQYRRHREPEQAPQGRTTPNPTEEAEAAGTPDAIKDAASRTAVKEKLAQVRGRGVDWVRPSDLFARGGGALSRRGIDLTAVGSHRLRTPLVAGARWAGERARQLPPLSAFGRRGVTDQGQIRSGVGIR